MPRDHKSRLRDRKELLAHRKRQAELGYDYPLIATYFGLPEDEILKARVRKISLQSAASIDQLPRHLQDIVNEGLNYLEKVQQQLQDEGANVDTLRARIGNNEAILPSANAFCLATFIDPPLVETEEERRQNPEAWLVTDIDPDDRIDIFFANLQKDSAAAKRFRIHRPKSVIDAQSRPAEPAREPIAIGHFEDRGGSGDAANL